MKKILFICTGNTCRSSMAEGIFNHAISQKKESSQFKAFSAGLSALDGDGANRQAIKVLKDKWNIDISCHNARRISEQDVEDSYIVLTMTREHKNAVIYMFPQAKNKIFTLKEFVSDNKIDVSSSEYNFALDISDPYGMSEQIYARCANEIREAIEKLIVKLREFEGL